jgi:DNA-binding HxlR family transcriptional regulator
VVAVLTGPWSTSLLWALHRDGPLHFGALRRALHGISAKVLTARLRRLEREGVVERVPAARRAAPVHYRLSPRGRALRRVLDDLDRVAKRWEREEEIASEQTRAPLRNAAMR